jgi:6-phosphogluconolactonase
MDMSQRTEVFYRVSESATELSRRAAEHFVEQAEEAANARGKARIAISGGSTPKRTFELLADPKEPYLKRMPWEKLELYWVDERCVPPDDADSNFRMTREALLSKVPLSAQQIFRIEGELPPEEAASRYESVIRTQFRLEGAELPQFDAIALGMGDDGHTASLFPHTQALHELTRIAVANHVPQKEAWRVTLTWPVLIHARDVFFLIEGKAKAAVLKEVLLGPYDPETRPSQLVQPKNGKLLFLLDKEAAALLPQPATNGEGRLEIAR